MILTGKRILVTAAAAGIGRAIAIQAAAAGARVLATDIDEAGLGEIASDAIVTAPLDATDSAAVQELVGGEAAFDGLAHAVGFVHHGTILDCEPNEWRRSFQINVDSMYNVLRSALPRMVEAGGGSIVSIASVASSLKGIINRAVYGATKAAMIGLTKSVAVDYVDKNIRCNTICPGTVESPSLQQRMRDLGEEVGGYDTARAAFIARQPMGRLGTPSEIARLAIYLLSDDAAYTTGQAHVIDGGILA